MMRNVLRILLSLIVIFAIGPPHASWNAEANPPPQSTQQPNLGRWRLDLIPAWRRAVARHQPGEMDQAAVEIEEWPKDDLKTAIRQVRTLAKLLADSPANAMKFPIRILLGLKMGTSHPCTVLKSNGIGIRESSRAIDPAMN